MGHARAVTLLALLVSATSPWPLAAQCPDGSPPPCGRAVAHAPPANSVAVLYLDNLSRDTADAYLADGLTEEIIIRLSQVQRLAVKSRFESQRFRGRPTQDTPALGRALDAAFLVTGSVQRAGDRVRLRVALVRAGTRAQVWGDVIDRTSSDLLTVESDIATAVTMAITGQLLPAERARLSRPLTTDSLAYEEYLRGLRAINSSYDEATIRSALAHFGRATGRDSGFAAAFAGQAQVWAALADGYVPPLEGYGRARVAANRALSRDSSQALAMAKLAEVTLALDLDAREAEKIARRAVAIDPRNGWAHIALSMALLPEGKFAAGVEEARRGWQLDSLAYFNNIWYGKTLIFYSRDSAAGWLPRLRALLPPSDADNLEGAFLASHGDLRGAEHLLGWREYGGVDAGMYVRALLARGDTAAARATVDSMLAARTPGYYNPIALARAYAALGDIDRGIEWLRRGFEERTLWVTAVRDDDELAPLRADPRYAALDQELKY